MRDAGPSERRFDIISGYQYWLRDLAPARVIPFRGPKLHYMFTNIKDCLSWKAKNQKNYNYGSRPGSG